MSNSVGIHHVNGDSSTDEDEVRGITNPASSGSSKARNSQLKAPAEVILWYC
jgi:hypothetical protein